MGRQAAPGQARGRRGTRIGDIEYRPVADHTMTRSSATSNVMAVSRARLSGRPARCRIGPPDPLDAVGDVVAGVERSSI